MQVKGLLDLIAADLNDPQHVVWTREQLRAYIQEGVGNAFVERPELFTEEITVKIDPCKIYQEVCECQGIRRVIGLADADGNIFNELRERTSKDKLKWPGKTCQADPNNFELSEFSVDTATNKIRVYPPVPAGMDVYVVVECAVTPDDFSDSVEIDANIAAAARQWALWCARMVDAENNPAVFNAANTHRKAFWELLISQKAGLDVDNDKDDSRAVNTQNRN